MCNRMKETGFGADRGLPVMQPQILWRSLKLGRPYRVVSREVRGLVLLNPSPISSWTWVTSGTEENDSFV